MEGLWKSNSIQKLKALGISALLFITLGFITDLIPNPIFTRMIKASPLDYFFWITDFLLITPIIYYYSRYRCLSFSSTTGGILGLLSFSCPLCSKLIVLVLGVSGALVFDQFRPVLGFLSILILAYVNYKLYFSKNGFKLN